MVSQRLDQVTLVDQNDRQIGVMDKKEAHLNQGKLHRAVSVFLFNSKGELLIQQRSKNKIVAALHWANTACGNVRPNETVGECARRRLREELGIKSKMKLMVLGKFQYQVSFDNGYSENEIDTVLAGFYAGEVVLNKQEVAATTWTALDQLVEKKSYQPLAPWLSIIIDHPELGNKLRELCSNLN